MTAPLVVVTRISTRQLMDFFLFDFPPLKHLAGVRPKVGSPLVVIFFHLLLRCPILFPFHMTLSFEFSYGTKLYLRVEDVESNVLSPFPQF